MCFYVSKLNHEQILQTYYLFSPNLVIAAVPQGFTVVTQKPAGAYEVISILQILLLVFYKM